MTVHSMMKKLAIGVLIASAGFWILAAVVLRGPFAHEVRYRGEVAHPTYS